MFEMLDLIRSIPLLLAVMVVLLSVASLWWTTRKERRILSTSLNRPLRDGEETSLSSWMKVSGSNSLPAARNSRRIRSGGSRRVFGG